MQESIPEELLIKIDKIVCEFSMAFGHSFTEEELEELVLLLGSGLKEYCFENVQ